MEFINERIETKYGDRMATFIHDDKEDVWFGFTNTSETSITCQRKEFDKCKDGLHRYFEAYHERNN